MKYHEQCEFDQRKPGVQPKKMWILRTERGIFFAISWDFCNNDEDMKPKNGGVNPVEY